MRIAPLCGGTANNARTPGAIVTGVNTGQRRTGVTPGSGSRTARILAVACGVVVPSLQHADPAVISQDQFNDVGRCACCPCRRHWLAPAGSPSQVWDRGDGERPAG
jgi:hypothetical protein